MDASGDHIRSTIEHDKEDHPHCSYSTLRSHFSSFLKAETLTKIIRNCEGEAPVEIFTHKNESDDSTGARGEANMPHTFSHPQQLPPMFPLPGLGEGGRGGGGGQGGVGPEDILASLFGHVLEGVFQGFNNSNSTGGGGGGGGFGSLFGGGGGFPFPPGFFPEPGYDNQQQQQQQQPQRRIPRPPHSFPRGHHRVEGGGEGEVTEI